VLGDLILSSFAYGRPTLRTQTGGTGRISSLHGALGRNCRRSCRRPTTSWPNLWCGPVRRASEEPPGRFLVSVVSSW